MIAWNVFGKKFDHRDIRLHASIFGLLFLLLCACSPIRYINIETYNPASLTFPQKMRRVLIVNNAVAQQAIPFQSDDRPLLDSVKISADSTTFDFCQTLGETLAEFAGFDDVRLLNDTYRKDQQLLTAPVMTQGDVRQLCDEHNVDVIVSLDLLLFKLNTHADYVFDMWRTDVEMAGLLRVYLPNRINPLTTIELADTIIPVFELMLEKNDIGSWDIVSSFDKTNLLRESAKFLAKEARIHFMPYWNEDIRWYYIGSNARWKEASAYAVSDRWDKALEIWQILYSQASSWKQKACLASNLALSMELTGDLNEALKYAELSHQFLFEHLEKDDPTVKRHERYISVLSNRILEEQRLRLQIND